ncbi:MAG: glycosyltransferase family 39 protein [Acidobacteria bacterium]|nr:glycosyltransferase family 39 protein [Acidobacteriota bacterium]
MEPLVPAVPAALAGLALFLLPGLTALALLGREERLALAFDEALYLAVATSVAVAAWIALALAELGVFSLARAGALLAAACAAAAFAGRRRLAWPLPPPGPWTAAVPAAIVLLLAFALQARPTEYLLGGRDPGTYVATMAVVGRTGGIAQTDPLVRSIPSEDMELFYRHPDNVDFSWGRFMGFPLERPQTGRVFPEFFHLFPAFGAYLFQAMGVKGALATPPVFGILGTLGVFFALRRLFGPAPALLGTLLLAVNVVQVWFARYPVSEPVSQFLIFLALLALAHWEERGSPAFGVLAGFALGSTLLVRIDSLLILVPLGIYLLVRRAHHDLPWRRAVALLLPFGLLALHAAVHAAVFSRKYVVSILTRPYWQQPPAVWIGLALVLAAALAVAHHRGPRLVERLEARREALQAGVIALVAVACLYAYFLRPHLSAWAGGDGNPEGTALADAGWLRDMGFAKLAAHDAQALVRLGWFVSPLGLLLGVLGLLVILREWRPRVLFLVLTALTFSAFYLYKIRVWNDYFFALRRYVPVVLPCLMGFAAVLLVRMARGGAWRRGLAGTLAAALLALSLRDTAPLARYVDWKGSVRFVGDVARRFGPDDVVVFEQKASIHLLSLPLWAVHGVQIAELARFNPDADRLKHLVHAWRGRYRNIYFVYTYRTAPSLCGLFLQRVEDYAFGTQEWERTLDRPPHRPEARALRFTLSRVVPPEDLQVPPLSEVDLGGTDDFQVSGFFDKEGGGEHTYRWTGPCASVYVPGARPGAEVRLRASSGRRPADTLGPVAVSLSGQALGGFVPGPEWTDHVLTLPDPLPPGPPVLRLDVPAFRPANVWEGDPDSRDLGVMVDRITIGARPGVR